MAEVTPANPLSDLPGYALRRAANAMMAELSGRLSALELRISDASLLLLVADRQDMTSSEIGKVLEIQRANMVPLLNRLEGSGLILRKPLNRKSQAIVLTAKGMEKLAEASRVTDAFEADLLDRIPAQHRAHLVPALKALVD